MAGFGTPSKFPGFGDPPPRGPRGFGDTPFHEPRGFGGLRAVEPRRTFGEPRLTEMFEPPPFRPSAEPEPTRAALQARIAELEGRLAESERKLEAIKRVMNL